MSHNKVFGIGLSRTGTKSLAAALNLLGIRTVWYPHDGRTYDQLAAGDYRLDVLESYDGITDTPVVPFYAQLADLFPSSRFVLTVRELESWLRSCEKHWAGMPSGPVPDGAPLWHRFAFFIDCCVYGCSGFNRERFAYVYQLHYESVLRFFRTRGPDRLLVFNLTGGDSWEKLCSFLNLEVPPVAFPWVTDCGSPLLS